jgi:hypothetical protein
MGTLRTILTIAGAIVAAVILFSIVSFVTALLFKIVTFAVFLALLYVVFLVARSALRKPSEPSPR